MKMMIDGGGGSAPKPAPKAVPKQAASPKKSAKKADPLPKPAPSKPKQATKDAKASATLVSDSWFRASKKDKPPTQGPAPSKAPPKGQHPTQVPPRGKPNDASTLDAKVATPEAKQKHITAQKAAVADANKTAQLAQKMGEDPSATKKAVLASYYKDHPTYVDEATGKTYAATYDEKTGEVKGTRNNDTEINLRFNPKGSPSIGGAAAPGGSPVQSPAPARAVGKMIAIGGPAVDTTLVVHPDGRVTATQTSDQPASTADDVDQKRTLTTEYDSSKKATGQTVKETGKKDLEGGGKRVTERTEKRNASGVPESSASTDTRTRKNGNTYVTKVDTTYDTSGKPQHEVKTDTAKENGITAVETHDKSYAADGAADETVTRKLTGESRVVDPGNPKNLLPWLANDPATITQTDKVHYNVDGQVDKIDSDYKGEDGNKLNDILRKQAPDSETTPYFAFGQVEARPSKDDKGELRIGTITGAAAAIEYRGIQVSVEGADPATDYPNHWADTSPSNNGHDLAFQDKFNTVRTHIDGLPSQLADHFDHLRYVNEAAPKAAAWAYGDNIVFFGGNTYSQDTLFHEAAHTAANAKNYDPKEWRTAAETDRKTREAFVDSIPEGSIVRGTNKDLLNNNLGVDDYGDDSLKDNGGGGEDWAEGTSLYLKSQRDGYIATVYKPDGTTQKVTFEDLYPERAKILAKHYDNFEGWHPGIADPKAEPSQRIPDPVNQAPEGARQLGSGGFGGVLGEVIGGVRGLAGIGGPAQSPGQVAERPQGVPAGG